VLQIVLLIRTLDCSIRENVGVEMSSILQQFLFQRLIAQCRVLLTRGNFVAVEID